MRILAILFFAFAFCISAWSQEENKTPAAPLNVWGNAGFNSGFNLQAAVNPGRFVLIFDAEWIGLLNDRTTAYSILPGYLLRSPHKIWMLIVAAGPGYIRYHPAYHEPEESIGLAAEVTSIWRFTRFFGAGAKLSCNLNKSHSYPDFGLFVQFGKLR